mgnify:FL=1
MAKENKGPRHVAIIMDGNGRWGERHTGKRTDGHVAGAKRVKEIVRYTVHQTDIRVVTLYAFSTENFGRGYEAKVILNIIKNYVTDEKEEMNDEKIQLRFIGDRSLLSEELCSAMKTAENLTEANTGLVLQIALSYGGRAEIIFAMKTAVRLAREGKLHEDNINEAYISSLLWTAGVIDPDLIIRTGGESRISNFLTWQGIYSEYEFLPEEWPDFTAELFEEVLETFHTRDRRKGGLIKIAAE